MKIPAIKAICKQARIISLLDAPDGSQWIGVPGAYYAVERDLELTKFNIPGLFDLSEDEVKSMKILQEQTGDVRYRKSPMPGEGDPCGRVGMSVNFMGSTYMTMRTPDGMLMVDVEKLKPVERKGKLYEFYLREAEGVPLLLAVYRDMEDLAALITPVSNNLAGDAILRIQQAYGRAWARDTGERTAEDVREGKQIGMEDAEDEPDEN